MTRAAPRWRARALPPFLLGFRRLFSREMHAVSSSFWVMDPPKGTKLDSGHITLYAAVALVMVAGAGLAIGSIVHQSWFVVEATWIPMQNPGFTASPEKVLRVSPYRICADYQNGTTQCEPCKPCRTVTRIVPHRCSQPYSGGDAVQFLWPPCAGKPRALHPSAASTPASSLC